MNRNTHPVEPEEVMSYLDGELDQPRAAVVAGHLEQCSDCQALTREMQQVTQQVASWQVEPPPDSLDKRVRAALQEQLKSKRKGSVATEPRRPFFQHWGWGLAAGLAIVLVAVSVTVPNMLRSRMAVSRTVQSDQVAEQQVRPQAELMRSESSAKSSGGIAGEIGGVVQPPPPAQVDEIPVGRPMIIRTATLTILTREFDNSRALMERTVSQLQGYIENLSLNAQSGAGRTLTATLRVPSNRLDTALIELRKLGRVEQESQTGEEITQQYADLVARLSNARNTEQRLIEVLQQRTGRMTDILAVEREIARVRGEIERMEAQRKGMETRVSFATLRLSLQEEHTSELGVAPPSTGNRLWNDLVAGYNGLVESGVGLLAFALRYGPILGFWCVLLFWPARRIWRHLRAAV